jgi:hypothetical protein
MRVLACMFGAAIVSSSITAAAEDLKTLTAADLAVQTHKWEGKRVETRMSCFYADKDEFRCVGSRARVDFTEITNADGRKFLEENCDTIAKSGRPRCTVTIRFVYESNERVETGVLPITYVKAEDNKGEVLPSKR